MAWPTLQDYNEALQSPAVVFSDPQLRKALPQTTKLGLPKVITGNFACVYRLTRGDRDWAVRCFHRRYAGHRQRYAEISRTLARLKLPYTVSFDYIKDGIRIRGKWYPILKMEWVRGVSLTAYIEENLGRPKVMRGLARRWKGMVAALKKAGIAHGDLQHGNIIVAEDKIRLVDYDGMYVPGLAGMRSNETGHPNYQHPHRMGSHFGAHLDNFSAWVIHLSLLALAADPELWEQTSRGDEALIFRKKDYDFPAQSRALGLVKASKDAEVRKLAKRFLQILRLPLPQVPSLDDKPPPAPKSARKPAPKAKAPAPKRARATTPPAVAPKSAPPPARSPTSATAGPSRPRSEHIPAAWLAGAASKAAPKTVPKTAPKPAPKRPTTGGPPLTSSKRAPPVHAPLAWGPQAAPVTAPGAAPAVAPPSPEPRHPVVRVLAAVWWVIWLLLRVLYFLVSRILWVLWRVVKYCAIGAYYFLRAVLWQAPRYFFRAVGRSYMKLPPPRRKRVLIAGAIIVTILGVALYFWHDVLLEAILGDPAASDVTGDEAP